MRRVEARLKIDLGEYLPRRYGVEGATQEQIATDLGVDGSTLSRWMAAFEIETRLFASERPVVAA